MSEYKRKLNKLQILSFVSCVLIVPPVFLSGCQSNEDRAEAHFKRAVALHEGGQPASAIVEYEHAIALKPDHAKAYCLMGSAYNSLGKYPDAIAVFKKAIAIKSDYARAYCSMGLAYQNSEQYPEALAAYKKTIALEPTSFWAAAACKWISEIEKGRLGVKHQNIK